MAAESPTSDDSGGSLGKRHSRPRKLTKTHLSFIREAGKLLPMRTLNFRHFTTFGLSAFLFAASPVLADQTVNTGIPGGDGKTLLDSGKEPGEVPDQNAILVHDRDCAKRTKGGEKLKNGKPNPAYEKCVHDKIEKAKKKQDPVSH